MISEDDETKECGLEDGNAGEIQSQRPLVVNSKLRMPNRGRRSRRYPRKPRRNSKTGVVSRDKKTGVWIYDR